MSGRCNWPHDTFCEKAALSGINGWNVEFAAAAKIDPMKTILTLGALSAALHAGVIYDFSCTGQQPTENRGISVIDSELR